MPALHDPAHDPEGSLGLVERRDPCTCENYPAFFHLLTTDKNRHQPLFGLFRNPGTRKIS